VLAKPNQAQVLPLDIYIIYKTAKTITGPKHCPAEHHSLSERTWNSFQEEQLVAAY